MLTRRLKSLFTPPAHLAIPAVPTWQFDHHIVAPLMFVRRSREIHAVLRRVVHGDVGRRESHRSLNGIFPPLEGLAPSSGSAELHEQERT